MSLSIGTEEHCGFYIGSEEICQIYLGSTSVFGCEEAPSVSNTIKEYRGGVYQFLLSDFTNEFTDPNGDSFLKTTIDTLPDVGIIKYSGVAIVAGFQFDLVNVINLTFEFPAGYTVAEGGYCIAGDKCYGKSSIKIGFRTSDNSTGVLYSDPAVFAFTLSTGNTPPTVSDNSAALVSIEYVFGIPSFTKDFADAEGDSYKNVRLKSLPLLGTLLYGVTPAVIGQTFLATDSPNLKFVFPDNYAVYSGVLYQFNDSLDFIIAEKEKDGYYLTGNRKGELTFTNAAGSKITVLGTVVSTPIRLSFSISDNNPAIELESEKALFTLLPEGDINVKPLHSNEPPVVGDNTFTI